MELFKTYEQIRHEKISTFNALLRDLGGYHVFNKPVVYRETPHSNTQFIYKVSIYDDINEIYDALDTIIQQLKTDIYRNGTDQRTN